MRAPLPILQIQFGIGPRIWLSEWSTWNIHVWFLRLEKSCNWKNWFHYVQLGKFKRGCITASCINCHVIVRSSNFVRLLIVPMRSSGTIPLKKLEENERTLSFSTSNMNSGINPFSWLSLISITSKEKDAFWKSLTWPTNWLLLSKIFCKDRNSKIFSVRVPLSMSPLNLC